jgi:protein-S-isoprenylcysteine O-methyltransferase Ste14
MAEIEKSLPWWRGARGEWLVVLQGVLFLVVAFAPRTRPGWPDWPAALAYAGTWVGALFLAGGGLLISAGIFRLGRNLTPLPYPKEQGRLVVTGAYRWVRHPIYSGGIFLALGWAGWGHGWLTLVYAAVLFVFFDFKSRREEKWLQEKYADYAAYQTRVRRLIPFIY